MKRLTRIAAFLLTGCLSALGQEPAPSTPTPPASGDSSAQEQQNATSATKDNSGTTGDQITKPAGAKGSTLIGCLAGPDKDGKYNIHNMTYRDGVQVLGSEELKNDAGSKVKLTGQWQPVPPEQGQANKSATRRFQIIDLEVVSPHCLIPSAVTPVSKNKNQKATTYNAPSSDSPK